MWQSKCVPLPPFLALQLETCSVAFWRPFALTCQDHSFLRATTFALDHLSRHFILLLIFHTPSHFLQEHLPTPILIIRQELKLLFSFPLPLLHEKRILYFTFTTVHWHTVHSRFLCIFWTLWIKTHWIFSIMNKGGRWLLSKVLFEIFVFNRKQYSYVEI